MAKAKSKKITIEEALVPVEEQEYNIPNNWIWIYQNFVCQLANGEKMSGEEYPYLEVKYLRGDTDAEIKDSGRFITANTKVILVDGENSGEVFEVLEDGYMGSTFKALNISEIVNEKYLLYYVDSKRELLKKNKTGSAIPHLNKRLFWGLGFPLPPLPEQQRIVEQIESLFTKLDEAKEKALSVVESFESRKIAILNNAFNGLYSTDWREKHHCTLDDWKDRKINEICIPRAGFAFNSKKFTESGIQIIRMGNLYAGKLNLSRSPVFYDISDVDDNIIKRSMVHDGDILLTLTGTKYKRDYGYAVCIEGEHELLVNQRILCLSPTEKIDKEYLLYYLRSEIFRDVFFSNETGGVNQGNVSSKFVENIEIKLPSIEEQKEISKILKNILTKEEQAKELAEFVIEQIELMKKPILAKAFRGELGTNIATEESAIELLKSIL